MSGLVGHVEPRIFTEPLRELTPETSWGFDIIWFAREVLREPFNPYQEWLAVHAFELLPPELVREMYPDQPHLWGLDVPRFKTVLLLVARQNGKTFFAKTVIKWALFRKRMKSILGAAQTKQDAWKLWQEILDDCRSTPPLRRRLGKVTEKNGVETIRNKHGGQYTIEGLDRGSGRGMTVNLLFMDEMREHKTWDGYSALSSTTLSPVGAMNLLASNAGDYRSVVLKSIRDGAHRAIADGNDDVSVGIFEWSADPALGIDDRVGWVQANPDLGHGRLTERDIQAEREAKTEEQFRTENLCQWVDDLGTDDWQPVLTVDEVAGMTVSGVRRDELSGWMLCVDASPDRDVCSVAVAGRRRDGSVVGMVGYHGPLDVGAVVGAVLSACESVDPAEVLVDPKSAAWVVGEALEREGIEVTRLNFGNVKAATGAFLQGQRDGSMVLVDDDGVVASAFGVAELKADANGGVRWARRDGEGAICQLTAVSYAMWAAQNAEPDGGVSGQVKKLRQSFGSPAVVSRGSSVAAMSF